MKYWKKKYHNRLIFFKDWQKLFIAITNKIRIYYIQYIIIFFNQKLNLELSVCQFREIIVNTKQYTCSQPLHRLSDFAWLIGSQSASLKLSFYQSKLWQLTCYKCLGYLLSNKEINKKFNKHVVHDFSELTPYDTSH